MRGVRRAVGPVPRPVPLPRAAVQGARAGTCRNSLSRRPSRSALSPPPTPQKMHTTTCKVTLVTERAFPPSLPDPHSRSPPAPALGVLRVQRRQGVRAEAALLPAVRGGRAPAAPGAAGHRGAEAQAVRRRRDSPGPCTHARTLGRQQAQQAPEDGRRPFHQNLRGQLATRHHRLQVSPSHRDAEQRAARSHPGGRTPWGSGCAHLALPSQGGLSTHTPSRYSTRATSRREPAPLTYDHWRGERAQAAGGAGDARGASGVDCGQGDGRVLRFRVCVDELRRCASSTMQHASSCLMHALHIHSVSRSGVICTERNLVGSHRKLETPLPSNSPHDHMILRLDLVGSHGRWKRPCLQTAHMTI